MKRIIWQGVSEVARLVLATIICFIHCAPQIYVPRSVAGLHCPTAFVQKIQSDNGDFKTPQPGDKEFKQCLCADKENIEQRSELETINLSSLVPTPTLCDPTYHLQILAHPFPYQAFSRQPSRLHSTPNIPPIPPPNA
jgi:hypothetical protein